MSDLTSNQERAAFHGVAMNRAYPTPVRIQAAVQALEAYEAEVEQLRNFIKALRNDEDYDPAPIVTEYDRVVEENARLFRIHEGWRGVIEKAMAYEAAWNVYSSVDRTSITEVQARLDKAHAHQDLLDFVRLLPKPEDPGA
jgi:hypothetical protein